MSAAATSPELHTQRERSGCERGIEERRKENVQKEREKNKYKQKQKRANQKVFNFFNYYFFGWRKECIFIFSI